MERLFGFAVRHPWRVLAVAIVLTGAALPGLARLTLRTDGHALVDPAHPAVREDAALRAIFPVPDPLLVLIETDHERGIYNPHTLEIVRRLTERLAVCPGVQSVTSLATEPGDRFRPGTLLYQTLLEEFPDTIERTERLREDVRALRLFHGTLVGLDERSTTVLVRVDSGVERLEVLACVTTLIAELSVGPDRVHCLGAPAAEALLGLHILEDLGVPDALLGRWATPRAPERAAATGWRAPLERMGLVPVALLVVLLVFGLTFRRPAAIVLPLVEVLACVGFVFGVMGWWGVPVYLTTAILPVILAAVGVADEVHVYTHYQRHRRQHPSRPGSAAVLLALTDTWRPIVNTSLTTAVGFCSFALSSQPPVQAFGLFTALGVLYCMVFSLTVVPALLTLWSPTVPVRQLAAPNPASSSSETSLPASVGTAPARVVSDALPGPGSALLAATTRALLRHRVAVLAVGGLLVAALPVGIARLEVQDSWLDGFAPDSALVRATLRYEQQYFGAHLLLVGVEGDSVRRVGELPLDRVEDHALVLDPAGLTDPQALVGARVVITRAPAAPQDTAQDAASPPPPALSTDPSGSPHDAAVAITAQDRGKDQWGPAWVERVETTAQGVRLILPRTSGSPRFWLRPQPDDRLAFEVRTEPLHLARQLARLHGLAEYLRAQAPLVGGVLGPADHAMATEFVVAQRAPDAWRLPDSSRRCEWIWQQLARIRGPERLAELVDESRQRGLLTVFLRDARYREVEQALSELRAYERRALIPHGLRLRLGGDIAVSQALIESIVTTQLRSLALSLAGIFLVAAFLTRSWTWGLRCLLPSALGVAGLFAAMGFLRIPLGVATSMFAGMLLGLGVDFAIHLQHRFRALCARGLAPAQAWPQAVASAGPPILVNAAAVALGLGVLALSAVPANARLGLLSAIGITVCLLVTLVLLPALSMPLRRSARST